MSRAVIQTITALVAMFAMAARVFALQQEDTPPQQQEDTLMQQVRQVVVHGHRLRSHLGGSTIGTSAVDLQLLDHLPRIMGNADPMHYAQMLPGVQTNSEFDAGLHIQGCDNQHNHVGIDGVPLYNVSHLLGFFSIFNPTHFQRMTLSRNSRSNHIGGDVDMLTADSVARQASGAVQVGPMSAQGTLRLPLTAVSQLTASARTAYLNLLYGPWLKFDDEQMRYGFSDYNLTWLWQFSPADRLKAEAYYGNDRLGYDDHDYAYTSAMKWQNALLMASWQHTPAGTGISITQTLYATHYDNRFALQEQNLHITMPSAITDWGYRLRMAAAPLLAELRLTRHDIHPQEPSVEGFLSVENPGTQRQRTFEAFLSADCRAALAPRLALAAHASATAYCTGGATFWAADPGFTLRWTLGGQSALQLHAGMRHQFLFRGGFSSIGLPTEFWFSCDSRHKPQWAMGASLGGEVYLLSRMLRLEGEVYARRLHRQQEYSGNIYDILYSEYSLDRLLMPGDGLNCGLSVMVEKRKGRLTGWVSYCVGRARRRFVQRGLEGWYPASHERTHELNVVATLCLSPRCTLAATLAACSGTPYTAPRQFYLVSSNVITQFGAYNAARLRPYMRLDLSACYDLSRAGRRRSGLNLSLYNATMHKNDLFCRLKIYQNQFANKPYRFLLPLLPSVSYYHEF